MFPAFRDFVNDESSHPKWVYSVHRGVHKILHYVTNVTSVHILARFPTVKSQRNERARLGEDESFSLWKVARVTRKRRDTTIRGNSRVGRAIFIVVYVGERRSLSLSLYLSLSR